MPKFMIAAQMYGPMLMTTETTSTSLIDMNLVEVVFNLIGTASSKLFTTYPLNIYVIMGIVGGAIALIIRGKRAAK